MELIFTLGANFTGAIKMGDEPSDNNNNLIGTGGERQNGNRYLTQEQWFSLPLELRQRWWREMQFNRDAPSEELLAAVWQALGITN